MLANKPLDIVKKYAPRVYFDNNEPFLPLVVGYTIADKAMSSPSFDRSLNPPENGFLIEYAIYWDWDIGHHYDLEHLWVYVNKSGEVEAFEASAHGLYINLWPFPPTLAEMENRLRNKRKDNRYCAAKGDNDNFSHIYSSGSGLIAYSQPGKHGFAPSPDWFEKASEYVISECTERAGSGGLLGGIYGDKLHDGNEDRDLLAREYLKRHAFIPSLIFEQIINLEIDIPLIPWGRLYNLIPERVEQWMRALARGEEMPGDISVSS